MYRKDYEDVPSELEWSFDKEDKLLDPVDWVKNNLEKILKHRISEELRAKALLAIQHFVNTSTHFIMWADEISKKKPEKKELSSLARKMAVLERKTFISFYNYFLENEFDELLDTTLEKIIKDPNWTVYWVNYFETALHSIVDSIDIKESLILQLKVNDLLQMRSDFYESFKKKATT